MTDPSRILPAEWHPQSAVQLTWLHTQTDWVDNFEESEACFVAIARAIAEDQTLLVVCQDKDRVGAVLKGIREENLILVELPNNDTWARDHGGITVLENGQTRILDFKFNGWGLKFPANLDNLLTQQLWVNGFLGTSVYEGHLDFVLEGGSIESDGLGTILTTTNCLLSPNRNGGWTMEKIDQYLKKTLGAQRILWLENGDLEGDDTDSHIDTLARFCNPHTIAYVQCDDSTDSHYEALKKMENELKSWTTSDGTPYQLVALPMADAVYHEGRRLPATYANFLITNHSVLLPFYGSPKDQVAQDLLQKQFPERKVIGINCTALIKQNGSLHCLTMQYPKEIDL